MFRILKKSLKAGVVTGQHPGAAQSSASFTTQTHHKMLPFKRSLAIREVDTGSCNACEMEMNALTNPVYDVERFGVHIAASPRHADALVVTGPVTVNMERALKDVHKQTPDPKLVIAVGDCCRCSLRRSSSRISSSSVFFSSFEARLNSARLFPSDFPSSGSLRGPKMMRAIVKIMMSSGTPTEPNI